MSTTVAGRYVGQSVKRVEDDRILTGRGRYIDDIRLPNMAHAVFLRSTIAHGRITSIDAAEARSMPGVIGVYTAEEIPNPLQLGPEAEPNLRPLFSLLAKDKVRYVGDPIAVIVADSRYIAEDARDAIVVDYESLAPVTTIEQSEDPASPRIFEDIDSNVYYTETNDYGDPESAFQGARVVRTTYRPARVTQVPMECRGGVADYNPGSGELVYYVTSQAPHGQRLMISGVLGQPMEKLRVVCPDIGGAFGQKAATGREDLAVCAASKLAGRPVKWVEDRVENMTASSHARSETIEIAAAIDDEGTILALDVTLKVDTGAYPWVPFPPSFIGPIVRTMMCGPYRIPHLRWRHHACATNKASYGAYRGPWAAETLARELIIDQIGRELGIDPLEIRRRNLVRADEMPYKMSTGPTIEGMMSAESLDRAAEILDVESFRREQKQAREQGRLIGLGLSTYIEPAPGPPDFWDATGMILPNERAFARLEPDGHVSVITSQAPHGQSHETTLAQIAATEMGVPLDHVRVIWGDTQQVPFSFLGTGGSRAATMASGAILHATRAVKEKVLNIVAGMLEIAPTDLEIVDAVVMPKGDPERGVPMAMVAAAAYFMTPDDEEPGLRSTGFMTYTPGGWSGGTHGVIVEVDTETGEVKILRYVVAEDCGDLINPAVVDGQIRGGIAQGIGIALLENALYDEDGNFLAGTFMDYLLPTAMEIPTIEIEHMHSAPLDEVSYRGVGEGGTIAAPPAVVNAIADALGVDITVMPVDPETVLGLLDGAGA